MHVIVGINQILGDDDINDIMFLGDDDINDIIIMFPMIIISRYRQGCIIS